MSRVRVVAGTRLRQLSDVTGDLQHWLRHLAYRVEKTQGGATSQYPLDAWYPTGSWRSRGDPPAPLIGGMHSPHCDQDERTSSLALTPQQREALRRVSEQVQAINKQVHTMREARRKRDNQHG